MSGKHAVPEQCALRGGVVHTIFLLVAAKRGAEFSWWSDCWLVLPHRAHGPRPEWRGRFFLLTGYTKWHSLMPLCLRVANGTTQAEHGWREDERTP